jgi:hypothetical protein
MDWDEILVFDWPIFKNLGPSIDAFYQVSVHLAEGF